MKPLVLRSEFWILLFLTLVTLLVVLTMIGLTDITYGAVKPTSTTWKPPLVLTRTATATPTPGWWDELPTPIQMPTWWATKTPTPTRTPTRTPWGWKSPTFTSTP